MPVHQNKIEKKGEITLDNNPYPWYAFNMKPSELIAWRKRHGLSQKRLADKLGVAEVTVFRWEKEMRAIPSLLSHALRGLEAEGGEQEVKGKGKRKEVKHGKRNLQKK